MQSRILRKLKCIQKGKNLKPFDCIIQILRRIYAFPSRRKEKFTFILFVKFMLLLNVLCFSTLLGMLGHLYITSVTENMRLQQIDNIMAQMQAIIGMGYLFILFVIGNKLGKFFARIQNYIFGKPKNIDILIQIIEKSFFFFYYASIFMCILYAINNYVLQEYCDTKMQKEDKKFLCGMPAPMWFPMKLNIFLNIYVRVLSFLNLIIYFPSGLLVPLIGIESILLIVERIRHLRVMMKRIDFTKNGNIKELCKQLEKSIIYYTDIKSLVDEMNDSVGYIFISQYSFMTIMLALFEYQLIKTGNIVLLMRFSGWLLMQIAICSSGQYLINESLQIRDAVYNMPWYDMPSELRRTFEVFLASVQKPMSLVAKPIVVLNNEYLLSVVKSSYSIMMFLQTWSSIEIE